MKKIFYILLIASFASCDSVNVSKDKETNSKNQVSADVESDVLTPYKNPFFIYGSDFGNFFQTMYKLGNYDQMIAFTSKESVDKFGKDVTLDFYKNKLDFGYDIGKYPLSNNVSGNVVTINYEANIMATKKIIRLNVVVENDSCKIVLPENLNKFPS